MDALLSFSLQCPQDKITSLVSLLVRLSVQLMLCCLCQVVSYISAAVREASYPQFLSFYQPGCQGKMLSLCVSANQGDIAYQHFLALKNCMVIVCLSKQWSIQAEQVVSYKQATLRESDVVNKERLSQVRGYKKFRKQQSALREGEDTNQDHVLCETKS